MNLPPGTVAAEAPGGRGSRSPASAVLVGFMASGKSAVGRAVAERLNVDFVDTDVAIEASHGPIPAIFARGGETLFREVERAVVLDVLSTQGPEGALVALGGGAVTIPAVRAALSGSPLVVWLTAPAGVLWERARRAPLGARPLAEDEAAFRALLAERDELYREVAGAIVANDGSRSVEDVAAEVAAVIRVAQATFADAEVSSAGASGGDV